MLVNKEIILLEKHQVFYLQVLNINRKVDETMDVIEAIYPFGASHICWNNSKQTEIKH